MPDAKRVGSLHAHSLPELNEAKRLDVYRCTCDIEFYMNVNENGEPDWYRVGESPHVVAYDTHDEGEPEIGRWAPSNRPTPPEGSGANATDDGIVIVDRQPKEGETTEEDGEAVEDADVSQD